VSFPVREPELPSSWRANSSSTSAVGAGGTADVVVRVGWLTAAGTYLQLSQSGGALPEVVEKETGRKNNRADGTVEVVGVTWTTYPAHRDEPAWVTAIDGTVVVITGSGTEDEFRQLATAVQEATPLT
jgi:hypothetical protein